MGGSWGVTLALTYAQSHPDAVAALILRGVCLLRPQEIDWFYKRVSFSTSIMESVRLNYFMSVIAQFLSKPL